MRSDYKYESDKFTLNDNAIPSIFCNVSIEPSKDFIEIISNEIIDEAMEQKSCTQCPFLLEKIKELKEKLLLMETEHCVSLQKIKQQNVELTEKKKQLKRLENEQLELKNVLDEMKEKNYISHSERDFLNVILFMHISI